MKLINVIIMIVVVLSGIALTVIGGIELLTLNLLPTLNIGLGVATACVGVIGIEKEFGGNNEE